MRKIKLILIGIILSGIVLFIGISSIKLKRNSSVELNEDIIVNDTNIDNSPQENLCNVDIKGAIHNPGVYEVNCKNTINEVIKLAGGLKEESDTSVINLAKKVVDEMVIIIYTKDEVKNSNVVDTVVKVIEKECNCPNIKNDGCINDKIDTTIGNNNLVNINKATLNELQELSGIGESKAKAIIKYREENDGFKKIDDLLNVEGIGEKLFEDIKNKITV